MKSFLQKHKECVLGIAACVIGFSLTAICFYAGRKSVEDDVGI